MQKQRNGAAKTALTVWREWSNSAFTSALCDCQHWQQDADRRRIGSVALSFNQGCWVVLVSQDLIDAELPF